MAEKNARERADSAIAKPTVTVVRPRDVHLGQFASWHDFVEHLFLRLVSVDRVQQQETIAQFFSDDAVFMDPFVRVRGVDKVKLIIGLIGPTCSDAQIKILDVFVQDRTHKADAPSTLTAEDSSLAAVFNLPPRPSADAGHTPSEFSQILPPVTHENAARAAVILQADVLHEYVFKALLPFVPAQLFTGRSFAYRSTHKVYLASDGKIIQHEELYSIREFFENFTAVRWLYRFYSWSNELIWQPGVFMRALHQIYS